MVGRQWGAAVGLAATGGLLREVLSLSQDLFI